MVLILVMPRPRPGPSWCVLVFVCVYVCWGMVRVEASGVSLTQKCQCWDSEAGEGWGLQPRACCPPWAETQLPIFPPSAAGPCVQVLHPRGPLAAQGQLQPAVEGPVGVRGVQARGESELSRGSESQKGQWGGLHVMGSICGHLVQPLPLGLHTVLLGARSLLWH